MFESDINLFEMLTLFGVRLTLVWQGSSVDPCSEAHAHQQSKY